MISSFGDSASRRILADSVVRLSGNPLSQADMPELSMYKLAAFSYSSFSAHELRGGLLNGKTCQILVRIKWPYVHVLFVQNFAGFCSAEFEHLQTMAF